MSAFQGFSAVQAAFPALGFGSLPGTIQLSSPCRAAVTKLQLSRRVRSVRRATCRRRHRHNSDVDRFRYDMVGAVVCLMRWLHTQASYKRSSVSEVKAVGKNGGFSAYITV